MEDSLKAYLHSFLGKKQRKELIAAVENREESQQEPIFRRFLFQDSAKLQAQLIDLIAEKGLSHEDLILILQTLRLNPELAEDLYR